MKKIFSLGKLKKLLAIVSAVFALANVSPMKAQANNNVKVFIDGVEQMFEVPAQIINDHTMVPMREMFEALNDSTEVEWVPDEQVIYASWRFGEGTEMIKLIIGYPGIWASTVYKDISAPPVIIEGRTLIPLRVVSETMGATVEWDGVNKHILITSPEMYITKPEYVAPVIVKLTKETLVNDKHVTMDMFVEAGYTFTEAKRLWERAVFDEANVRLEAEGISNMIWSDILHEAAEKHAVDQVKNRYQGHKDLDGNRAWVRAERAGWNGPIAENISSTDRSRDTPDKLINRWYSSSGHRVAMISGLNGEPTYAAVGVEVDGRGSVVMVFGQKR